MEVPLGFEIIEKVIENTEEVIKWMEEQDNWEQSKIQNNSKLFIDSQRTSSSLAIPLFSFNNPDFIHNMNKTVWHHIDNYAKKWDFVFTGVENVSVQRYYANENQHYNYHVDSGYGSYRIVSALLYLNDVEEGGQTYFPHFNFAIKPQAGRLAIFPSNFIYGHEALPPKSSVKYAAAYWATY